jgi:hypothetical protein
MPRWISAITTAALATMPVWLGCGGPTAPGDVSAAAQQHNAALPYQAWTFALDKSRSLRPEQFQKMKRVAAGSVETDVQSNDLTWLVPIESGSSHATIFPIAPVGSKRIGGPRMRESKTHLTSAIAGLEQASARTDLGGAIGLSLNLLQGQPDATARYAVFASDFVNDTPEGGMSLEPPAVAAGLSAKGIYVILLVAIPKDDYLRALHVSAPALFHSVDQKYRRYFEELGPEDVTVQLLDALPVARRAAPPVSIGGIELRAARTGRFAL